VLSPGFRSSFLPAPAWVAAAWLVLGVLGSWLPFVGSAQGDETVLIVAPHEDDEVLMVTGAIEDALQQGATVKVAILTDGAGHGDYDVRAAESLNALAILGLAYDFIDWTSSDIHFLGYGDATLGAIAEMAAEAPPSLGREERRPTGRAYRTSAIRESLTTRPAAAPRPFSTITPAWKGKRETTIGRPLVGDLLHIIETDHPDRVFIPLVYDAHPDHEAAGKLTVMALRMARISDPGYAPTIYQYLVHQGDDDTWPNRNWGPVSTGLPCSEQCYRGAFLIPHRSHLLRLHRIERMPLSSATQELKFLAISEYPTQAGGYLSSFIKNEEFFWVRRFDSLSYAASSVAVSEEDDTTRQWGTNAIDGIVDGYVFDPLREWVTQGQTAGAWIELTWDPPRTIDRVILYDRPNLNEQIQNANLVFTLDGTSETIEDIGPLSDDGSGDIFDFAPRRVDSVKLEIVAARGANTGLAEFEVFLLPEPAASLQLLAGGGLLWILAWRKARTSPTRGEPG
jgi:LmbE family N-acetylglucosaminyl deacetylase